ncbi:hypothetical protein ACWDZ4_05880 [Streptomyces sp. NPDC003016]
MLRHAIAPVRRFLKVSHDVVRHARLNSDAKILLLYVHGLPDGLSHKALSEHAAKLGIKGRAYQRAKELLIASGHLHEWRAQNDRGRWVTTQLLANVTLTSEEAARLRDAPPPGEQNPTVGGPTPRVVGDYPPEDDNGEKNTPHPPSEGAPSEGASPEPAPETGQRAEAEQVLLSLRHTHRDLHLGVREARSLAESAAEWLRRGVSPNDLCRALATQLPPEGVRSAVGFLRHRLIQKLPDARPLAPTAPPPPPPHEQRTGLLPVTCQGPGNEHVFRPVGDETHCGPCRREAAAEAHYARTAQTGLPHRPAALAPGA